jgi:hypothetical protein
LEFVDQYRSAVTYNVNSFALYAPSDATLSGSSATGLQFQGSSDGVNWTTLYSTTTIGSVAEVLTSISSNLTTGNFQQHRFAIQSQGKPITVAQARMNVGRHWCERGLGSHPMFLRGGK